MSQEKMASKIPAIIDGLPLSSQIKLHLERRSQEGSRSSSRHPAKFSPTKMSSLSRSPARSGSMHRSGTKLLNSQSRRELMMYFGLSNVEPVGINSQASSPLKRSLYANTLNELDTFESKLDNKEANKLIQEELACSPVRTAPAITTPQIGRLDAKDLKQESKSTTQPPTARPETQEKKRLTMRLRPKTP
jgi:hypothetical protein